MSALVACEANAEPLLRLAVTIACDRPAEDGRLVGNALARGMVGVSGRPAQQGAWPCLPVYPVLLVAFAFGVGCAHQDQWRRASRALRRASSGKLGGDQSVLGVQWAEFDSELQESSRDRQMNLSRWIGQFLRPFFGDWIVRDTDYRLALERFELFFSMVSEDVLVA